MNGRVLVIGIGSPIGTAIGHELTRRGVPTTGTSRRAVAGALPLDVGDPAAVRSLLAEVRPDSVVYLASPDPSGAGAQADAALHALGAFLEAAGDHGARRVVFASSAAVYGTARGRPLREDDEPAPDGPYGALKSASEEVLRAASRDHGIEAVALRVFNVYGPGLRGSLINRMFGGEGSAPEVYDTPGFTRDYIHVDDVARAFAAALEAPLPGATTLNVGTGVATANSWLLSRPGALGIRRTVDADYASHSLADTSRQQALLGLEAEVMLDAAIADPERFLR